MDRRLEGILHRWLPALAGVAIAVAGITYWLKADALSKAREEDRQRAASEVPVKPPDPALVEASAGATLEQVARLITRLDSDVGTQRALAEAFAQNDTLQRLWVVDERGYIVYYAKEQPAARTVDVLAPREVHTLLETLPAGLLRPEQRLAILTAAAVKRSGEDFIRDGFVVGSVAPSWSKGEMGKIHTRLLPIKGGLIAVAAKAPSFPISSHLKVDIISGSGKYDRVIGNAMIVYWLSIPLWVVLDALRHKERAVVWGLFTLIGNIVALLIYLLSRSRNGAPSAS